MGFEFKLFTTDNRMIRVKLCSQQTLLPCLESLFVSWMLNIPATRRLSQGQMCLDHFTRYHTVMAQNCNLIQSVQTVSVMTLLMLVACLMSQQHASVSYGQIFSDNFMCCHTEIELEVADQLPHPEYTDTKPTNPSTNS